MSGHPSPDPATELRVGNRLSGFPRNGLSALCRTRFSLQTQCVAIDNMCVVWYIASLRKGSKLTAVWPIGHSTHDRPKFERLLAAADIGAVADVRSFPSSRLPHFGRAALAARLNASGIAYVYLGRELGGRRGNEPAADYEAMAKQPLFLEGLAKVETIASRVRLALMCLEHGSSCLPSLLAGWAAARRARRRRCPHSPRRPDRAERVDRGAPPQPDPANGTGPVRVAPRSLGLRLPPAKPTALPGYGD